MIKEPVYLLCPLYIVPNIVPNIYLKFSINLRMYIFSVVSKKYQNMNAVEFQVLLIFKLRFYSFLRCKHLNFQML